MQSPVTIGINVSPSKDAIPFSQSQCLPFPISTVITSCAGKIMLLVFSVCGAMGVMIVMAALGDTIGLSYPLGKYIAKVYKALGDTIGPPADRLYPVDPVGVEIIIPSAL